MSVVLGPVLWELADLAVRHRGVGAVSQQPIDHFLAAAERRVVQGCARKIKAGRNEVHWGSVSKQLGRRYRAVPGRRVNQSISQDLLRVSANRLRNQYVEERPGDFARRRRQRASVVEAKRYPVEAFQSRSAAEVGDGGASLKQQRHARPISP